MDGKPDFEVFWKIGKVVLSGGNPYGFYGSWYPPAATILFSIFALVPVAYAIWLWRVVLTIMLAKVVKRDGWGWLLFVPLPFIILAGQVDLVLIALIPLLSEKGWKGALAAFAFTLKPILAVVILPWFILKWLREDPRTLNIFLVFSLIGHTWPLIVRPSIFAEWGAILFGDGTANYYGGGLFALKDVVPVPVLALVACGLVAVALTTKREALARSALMLASPISMPYHDGILTYSAPSWIMAAASILMIGLFAITGSQACRVLVPLTALAVNGLTITASTGRISKTEREEVAHAT